ncbi:single-stranded-DNA-specific exonuclease RecJ [Natroniella acetigena]|uniref:single-stranded-DNA-specific exonuclease RecJ n=1 Tax=Natroniella acetigena TaxID=52004 RepID=UPI00200B0182|nr:single-stranded-DNA-specific exonuclease RecJ [Natroniella acetigena]MCK8827365.1 single-stranded-DNA-specific exonuclease RecJ [Natroniella acetigena]
MKITVDYKSEQNIEVPQFLVDRFNGDQLLARIFYNRGLTTPQKSKEFLDPQFYTPTEPEQFPKIEQAVTMILEAVETGQKISVYGDYDVDGVTATTILVSMLTELEAQVSYHIPDRFTEGYGINQSVIKDLADRGIDLIITCDCGISNQQEIALAKQLGMQVIVTDHHQLPEELPAADLILSPKLLPADHQAYYLPGAGMAYFLAWAVFAEVGQEDQAERLLDLAALAIVADVVPLQDENRYLLQQGLNSVATTDWVGIEELCQLCNLEPFNLSAEDIGFQIAPRINATGRIRNAREAVELFLSSEPERAKQLAAKLDQINEQRKEISAEMEEEALSLLPAEEALEPIILYQEDWHQGILGIVAGRLSEKFGVPALLMTLKEGQEIITGSARSIPGLHIYHALQECAHLLEGFGGHAGAAGFSLTKDKLADFKKELRAVLKKKIATVGEVRKIEVDGQLSFDRIDLDFYKQLQELAPFGEQNPKPLFYSSQVEVVSARPFTSGSKHLNLLLDDRTERISAVWWRADEELLGDKINLVYSLDLDTWRGRREVQLVIKEVVGQQGELNREEKRIDYQIKDYRNHPDLKQHAVKFNDPIYYYEGLEDLNLTKLINRYQTGEASTLVLLSCPPELNILEELIIKFKPQQLILGYSNSELRTGKEFLNLLSKLIKYIIEEKSGRTSIFELAALTSERERTVFLALKQLRNLGYIDFELINPNNILLKYAVKEQKLAKDKKNEARLKELLKETRAFKRYLLEKDVEQLYQLLN